MKPPVRVKEVKAFKVSHVPNSLYRFLPFPGDLFRVGGGPDLKELEFVLEELHFSGGCRGRESEAVGDRDRSWTAAAFLGQGLHSVLLPRPPQLPVASC